MALGAVVARIITQYSDKGSKAAKKDIKKLGDSFDNFSKRTVRAFGIATAAVGAFALKVGKDAVKAAMDDQKAQVLLANSLRNTTGATNAAIASVENYIGKLQVQVGVADDELRPALAKLASVTGDVVSAQQLLGVALDVSAFSGADLGSATSAVTRALQGNFKSLQKLVPSISATTIKSKNLAKVFEEVQKATSGSAATRADTLEFRLNILRIRYSEILETLGYQLLPVIEKFVATIQTKVLPQLETWIATNKDKFAAGLKFATEKVVQLLMAAIAFSDWIANNMGLVKTMAAIIGTMFVVGKVAAFVTAIQTLAGAFTALRASAAGAAIAAAFATGGTSIIAATAALTAVGGAAAIYTGLKSAGDKARSQKTGPLGNYAMSTGSASIKTPTVTKTPEQTLMDALLKSQNQLNNAKKKELTTEQKIINAMLKKYGLTLMTSEIEAKATAEAIRRNLNRQGNLGISSPTISLVASANTADQGTLGNNSATAVTVNITTPYGTKDDFFVDVSNNLKTLRRRSGMTPNGKMTGIGIE